VEWWLILGIIFGALLLLLAVGVPVAFAFLIINLAGAAILQGGTGGFQQIIHSIFGSVTSFSLLPIPLFVLMGEILWQTNIAARALTALDKLLGRLPGRLSLLTVTSGTIFAALSGSTIANTAMLGSLLLPDLKKRGYADDLSMGAIMASGALAMLVPPSALAVIFAVIAKISIGEVLIALIAPGLLLAVLYAIYIMLRAKWNPAAAPAYDVKPSTAREKLMGMVLYVAPLSFVVFMVIGVMVLGVATPTEAAAFGCVGSMMLAAAYRDLTWKRFRDSIEGTLRISAMMLVIMACAIGFSQLLAYSGGSRGLLDYVMSFDVSPIMLLILMQLILLVLGCFMEQIAIMLITLPIFMPIIKAAGIDPIWFAVVCLINLEVALLTPPFGLLLFVMKGAAPKHVNMQQVYMAAVPYLAIDIAVIGLLIAFPSIATVFAGLMR
jgi:tripartite ATP-independent transporter DctM subunit